VTTASLPPPREVIAGFQNGVFSRVTTFVMAVGALLICVVEY